MSDAEMTEGANQDQSEYWNSETGQKWVAFQESLDQLFLAITERLLERLDPKPRDRVLDVGCGTGATSLLLAERVGAEGSVVAVDISELLLARAAERKSEGPYDNVEFRLADAQTHEFPAGAVDLISSRFGVMFFNDPVAAFTNLSGALRPGGRLCFASWAPASENPWFEIPRDAAIVRMGTPAPPPPRAPGPFAFAEIDYVLDILAKAGFADPVAEVEQIDLFHPGSVESAAHLAANLGISARIVKAFDGTPEDIEAIAREAAKGYQAYAVDDGMRVPAKLNFFHAIKP